VLGFVRSEREIFSVCGAQQSPRTLEEEKARDAKLSALAESEINVEAGDEPEKPRKAAGRRSASAQHLNVKAPRRKDENADRKKSGANFCTNGGVDGVQTVLRRASRGPMVSQVRGPA
jgi:hypothetical protein